MLVKFTTVKMEFEPQSEEDQNNNVPRVYKGVKELLPVWVNSNKVILFHSFKNGTSMIRVSENETIWVKGTGDEVAEKLNDTL